MCKNPKQMNVKSSVNVNHDNLSTWYIPLVLVISMVIGAGVGLDATLIMNPSGILGSPATFSYTDLDLRFVTLFFGVPFSALAATLLSYMGIVWRRPLLFSIISIFVGIAVFAVIGIGSADIGIWWINSLPKDTNQTAAIMAGLLSTPATLAILIASRGMFGDESSPRFIHYRILWALDL
ncbi:MAG: hypothetical protein ACP5UL_06520 [Thermoplasmata archaeon]